jgi:hypothetical protein
MRRVNTPVWITKKNEDHFNRITNLTDNRIHISVQEKKTTKSMLTG